MGLPGNPPLPDNNKESCSWTNGLPASSSTVDVIDTPSPLHILVSKANSPSEISPPICSNQVNRNPSTNLHTSWPTIPILTQTQQGHQSAHQQQQQLHQPRRSLRLSWDRRSLVVTPGRMPTTTTVSPRIRQHHQTFQHFQQRRSLEIFKDHKAEPKFERTKSQAQLQESSPFPLPQQQQQQQQQQALRRLEPRPGGTQLKPRIVFRYLQTEKRPVMAPEDEIYQSCGEAEVEMIKDEQATTPHRKGNVSCWGGICSEDEKPGDKSDENVEMTSDEDVHNRSPSSPIRSRKLGFSSMSPAATFSGAEGGAIAASKDMGTNDSAIVLLNASPYSLSQEGPHRRSRSFCAGTQAQWHSKDSAESPDDFRQEGIRTSPTSKLKKTRSLDFRVVKGPQLSTTENIRRLSQAKLLTDKPQCSIRAEASKLEPKEATFPASGSSSNSSSMSTASSLSLCHNNLGSSTEDVSVESEVGAISLSPLPPITVYTHPARMRASAPTTAISEHFTFDPFPLSPQQTISTLLSSEEESISGCHHTRERGEENGDIDKLFDEAFGSALLVLSSHTPPTTPLLSPTHSRGSNGKKKKKKIQSSSRNSMSPVKSSANFSSPGTSDSLTPQASYRQVDIDDNNDNDDDGDEDGGQDAMSDSRWSLLAESGSPEAEPDGEQPCWSYSFGTISEPHKSRKTMKAKRDTYVSPRSLSFDQVAVLDQSADPCEKTRMDRVAMSLSQESKINGRASMEELREEDEQGRTGQGQARYIELDVSPSSSTTRSSRSDSISGSEESPTLQRLNLKLRDRWPSSPSAQDVTIRRTLPPIRPPPTRALPAVPSSSNAPQGAAASPSGNKTCFPSTAGAGVGPLSRSKSVVDILCRRDSPVIGPSRRRRPSAWEGPCDPAESAVSMDPQSPLNPLHARTFALRASPDQTPPRAGTPSGSQDGCPGGATCPPRPPKNPRRPSASTGCTKPIIETGLPLAHLPSPTGARSKEAMSRLPRLAIDTTSTVRTNVHQNEGSNQRMVFTTTTASPESSARSFEERGRPSRARVIGEEIPHVIVPQRRAKATSVSKISPSQDVSMVAPPMGIRKVSQGLLDRVQVLLGPKNVGAENGASPRLQAYHRSPQKERYLDRRQGQEAVEAVDKLDPLIHGRSLSDGDQVRQVASALKESKMVAQLTTSSDVEDRRPLVRAPSHPTTTTTSNKNHNGRPAPALSKDPHRSVLVDRSSLECESGKSSSESQRDRTRPLPSTTVSNTGLTNRPALAPAPAPLPGPVRLHRSELPRIQIPSIKQRQEYQHQYYHPSPPPPPPQQERGSVLLESFVQSSPTTNKDIATLPPPFLATSLPRNRASRKDRQREKEKEKEREVFRIPQEFASPSAMIDPDHNFGLGGVVVGTLGGGATIGGGGGGGGGILVSSNGAGMGGSGISSSTTNTTTGLPLPLYCSSSGSSAPSPIMLAVERQRLRHVERERGREGRGGGYHHYHHHQPWERGGVVAQEADLLVALTGATADSLEKRSARHRERQRV